MDAKTKLLLFTAVLLVLKLTESVVPDAMTRNIIVIGGLLFIIIAAALHIRERVQVNTTKYNAELNGYPQPTSESTQKRVKVAKVQR